jgi:hypothetical protein
MIHDNELKQKVVAAPSREELLHKPTIPDLEGSEHKVKRLAEEQVLASRYNPDHIIFFLRISLICSL